MASRTKQSNPQSASGRQAKGSGRPRQTSSSDDGEAKSKGRNTKQNSDPEDTSSPNNGTNGNGRRVSTTPYSNRYCVHLM